MHNMPSLLSASVACIHAIGGGGGVYPMHSMPGSLSANVAGAGLHALRGGWGDTQCTVRLVHC